MKNYKMSGCLCGLPHCDNCKKDEAYRRWCMEFAPKQSDRIRELEAKVKALSSRPTYPPTGAIDYPRMMSEYAARLNACQQSCGSLRAEIERLRGLLLSTADEIMDMRWAFRHHDGRHIRCRTLSKELRSALTPEGQRDE